MKIRVAILDGDKTYLSKFFDCFNKNYCDKIEIHAFTTDESLRVFLMNNKIDILLLQEDLNLNFELNNKIIIIKLVEKNSLDNHSDFILKYQKLSLIYKEILNAYSNVFKETNLTSNENKSINIISFMSSGTGAGTSTLASAYAIYLTNKNKKTLFLDLQSFATVNCIFQSEGKFSMSEIIYAIKSNKADITLRLESALKVDKSGVFFYDPCKNPLERSEISKENLITFINAIKALNYYDYIIIDIDYLINDICLKLLEYSNKIVFVASTTDENNQKLAGMLKSIDLIQKQNKISHINKINIIYNKFTNGKGKLIGNDNLKIVGYIPKFSDSNIRRIVKEISETSVFDSLIDDGGKNEFSL